MSDQADKLRQLVGASRGVAAALAVEQPAAVARESSRTTRSLLFTSGKGGVGTSNLVLNLAIALGELGERVLVVDADLGLANLDLLCGLAPRYDLGDVLAGRCTLEEAVATGPGPIQIVPGAHALRAGAEVLDGGPARLVAELGELESAADYVLVDAGSGLNPGVATLAAAADQAVIVTTPEPTSIADAHAAIHRLRRLPAPPRLRVVVNQAASAAEAAEVLDRLVASSRQFLATVVLPLGPGAIRADPHVGLAVRSRKPLLTAFPGSLAARGLRRLARSLVRERLPQPRSRRAGFFAAIAARWALSHVATG
ncbi:MAG TPA: AAA family ATPase [Isosphaeraceae bacterium]|nr:AAA family ATPase [Isosphaeraceae bacterium]